VTAKLHFPGATLDVSSFPRHSNGRTTIDGRPGPVVDRLRWLQIIDIVRAALRQPDWPVDVISWSTELQTWQIHHPDTGELIGQGDRLWTAICQARDELLAWRRNPTRWRLRADKCWTCGGRICRHVEGAR
jgi:hypothetical protein